MILVIEDHPALLRLILKQLTDAGYSVVGASDADEATRLASQTENVDVIVMDSVVPGPLDLVERLTALHPSAERIWISGHDPTRLREAGLLDEESRFLHKPFTRDELLEAVADVGASRPGSG